MISMPADSVTDWVMVRHNTQTFEHFLNLHFIQVQIINMPFSYIRLQMICLVILSFKNSTIFRKEKVIIIAGSRLQVNRKSGLHFRKNKAWPACERTKHHTSMPRHISRKKGTMREDNEIFSFFCGRVSRSDSEPPIGTLLLLLKTTVF